MFLLCAIIEHIINSNKYVNVQLVSYMTGIRDRYGVAKNRVFVLQGILSYPDNSADKY